ncbi:MAG: hypothetical protein P1U77_11990 [Rubripirellula sp.]|nr:hypothetical protein [Rubripirellula sp.]
MTLSQRQAVCDNLGGTVAADHGEFTDFQSLTPPSNHSRPSYRLSSERFWSQSRSLWLEFPQNEIAEIADMPLNWCFLNEWIQEAPRMSHRSSLAILLAVFVGSLMMQATEPPQKGYPLPEDVVIPEPTHEDRLVPLPRPGVPMQQHLKELIPAGDLIGAGVHEVIQARGSVLDKFPTEEQLGLAPKSRGPGNPALANPASATEADFDLAPESSHLMSSHLMDRLATESISSGSQRAMVAEQLLKSARLLENLGGHADYQRKLIDQLRVEARNLLSE